MKTIAFYIGSLEKGGAERVFVNLAEFFESIGYNVVMVTQYKKNNEYRISDNVVRILSDIDETEVTNSRIVNFSRRFFKLRNIWKKNNIDLVLTCTAKNNFMTIVSSWGLHTKPVVSVVGEARLEYPGRLMRFLANFLFPFASGIILQTEKSRKFFSKYVNKKAVVLPNSLNPLFMTDRYEGEKEKNVVAVGRMDDNKNHAMIISAFSKLVKKYPEYTLTIYGDGEKRKYLNDLVHQLNIDGKVYMPGVINNIQERIYKSRCFVIASDSEGVSNALIEALALGIPSIATDVPSGGTRELIENEINGIIIPVQDEEKLIESMDRIMGDDSLVEKLSVNAAKIQTKLAPERVNKMWKDYFEKIIGC